ncbi:unnamed protein product, partial [Heterosigma akashiwo]
MLHLFSLLCRIVAILCIITTALGVVSNVSLPSKLPPQENEEEPCSQKIVGKRAVMHQTVPVYRPYRLSEKDEAMEGLDLQRWIDQKILGPLEDEIREHNELVEKAEILDGKGKGTRTRRPFVTLTYAQSLDGSISQQDKGQVILSGWESLVMTHGLRNIHDAILIGSGTAINDSPKLSVRHWKSFSEEDRPIRSPQPVVLDRTLKSLPHLKFDQPALIFSAPGAAAAAAAGSSGGPEHVVLTCPAAGGGGLALRAALAALYDRGHRSVMVEGGGAVLAAFLAEGLVDKLIVTVAPTLLARGYNPFQAAAAAAGAGAGAGEGEGGQRDVQDVDYFQLGRDVVLVG